MAASEQGIFQPRLVEQQASAAVLTSWKDIARYVGKGVRTVQRWERDLGLPVRRPGSTNKSAVLALPYEISCWVRAQKFQNGQTDLAERSVLLLHIEFLQAQNLELKRQLQATGGKTT